MPATPKLGPCLRLSKNALKQTLYKQWQNQRGKSAKIQQDGRAPGAKWDPQLYHQPRLLDLDQLGAL
ncbi:hypothetical protein DAI22_11g188500 [Oryza sativa Japonica Group]|nr:hypothetical protein DAI22_11g188500 [Oryza sativa Japonica Group]